VTGWVTVATGRPWRDEGRLTIAKLRVLRFENIRTLGPFCLRWSRGGNAAALASLCLEAATCGRMARVTELDWSWVVSDSRDQLIARMPELRKLVLHTPEVAGDGARILSGIAECGHLQHIALRNSLRIVPETRVAVDALAPRSHRSLTHLELHGCTVTFGAGSPGALPALRALRLDGCFVGLEDLQGLCSSAGALRTLALLRTVHGEDDRHLRIGWLLGLAQLQDLDTLELDACCELTPTVSERLRALSSLRHVNLADRGDVAACGVPQWLGALPATVSSLELDLGWRCAAHKTESLELLSRFERLVSCTLTSARMNGRDMEVLARAAPSLRSLAVHVHEVEGHESGEDEPDFGDLVPGPLYATGASALAGMPHLRHLGIENEVDANGTENALALAMIVRDIVHAVARGGRLRSVTPFRDPADRLSSGTPDDSQLIDEIAVLRGLCEEAHPPIDLFF